MDIRGLNLINAKIRTTPGYDLSKRQPSICLFLSRDGRLFLLGRVDNNYAYWTSLTRAEDRETNGAIFTQIGREEVRVTEVAAEYAAIQAAGLSREELATWYQADLVQEERDGEKRWSTPFGCYYGNGTPQELGAFFGRDVAHFPAVLKERCRFREANGEYASILGYCLDVLRSDHGNDLYYTQVEDLADMMRRERYLVFSDNQEIRELYLEIQQTVSRLYNRYQSAVR